jgi:hypothetical protein
MEEGSPPRTPPATTIRLRIEDLQDDIRYKIKELSNITRNISQLDESRDYFDNDSQLRYLVDTEKELEKELRILKRKRDTLYPKTHTKRMRPLFSRSRSLSLGRSNSNKKEKLHRTNSLGGTRKRSRKTRK